jgi:hypothetical protein
MCNHSQHCNGGKSGADIETPIAAISGNDGKQDKRDGRSENAESIGCTV